MKMRFSLAAILLTLLSGGWSKEVKQSKTSSITKRLYGTTLKQDQVINYNSDGTPQTVSWVVAGNQYVQTFSYVEGRISYVITNGSIKTEQGEYLIENGRVVSLDWTHFDDRQISENNYVEKFLYNEKGLLQKHSFNKSWSEYHYNNDGDLTTVAHFNENGRPTTKVEYTYTGIKDLFPSLGYFKTGASGFFLPAFSKHLPATRKVTKLSTGQVTRKGVFAYKLDSEGYLVKGKWDGSAGEDTDYEWTNRFQ